MTYIVYRIQNGIALNIKIEYNLINNRCYFALKGGL